MARAGRDALTPTGRTCVGVPELEPVPARVDRPPEAPELGLVNAAVDLHPVPRNCAHTPPIPVTRSDDYPSSSRFSTTV